MHRYTSIFDFRTHNFSKTLEIYKNKNIFFIAYTYQYLYINIYKHFQNIYPIFTKYNLKMTISSKLIKTNYRA